jgi:hypothetical protein
MLVEKLKNIELQDHSGDSVRLGSLWANRAAVFVWVRHFG